MNKKDICSITETVCRRKHAGAVLFCLAASVLLLMLGSMSSPLYPLNIWCDANAVFTTGRMMKDGAVLYRDVVEQKGPLFYLIQMVGAYISDTSFFGVYLMEVLFFAATLYAAYRLMCLGAEKVVSLSGAALYGACVLAGRAFSRGNSAEEFCLPFLMAAVYLICVQDSRENEPLSPGSMMICGLLAGLCATIKFTLLAPFAALCLVQGLIALRRHGMRRVLVMACAFLAAMLLPILPWIFYFAANGALDDFYTVYIYNNIFLYGAEKNRMFLWALELFVTRNLWVIPAIVGILAILASARRHLGRALTLLGMAAAMFVMAFCMGQYYVYYPLPLCIFAVAGIAAVLPFVERLCKKRLAAACACGLLAFVIAWKGSPNAFLRGMPIEYTAQGILAQQIEPGSSLLQYSFLDEGLYLTSGILPQEKYFVQLNAPIPEMQESLDAAVREGRPDYVLISCRELPAEFDRYEQIACEYAYDDLNNLNKPLYLYRRKAE